MAKRRWTHSEIRFLVLNMPTCGPTKVSRAICHSPEDCERIYRGFVRQVRQLRRSDG